MASTTLDKSLDDMIKSRPRGGRRPPRRGRGAAGGDAPTSTVATARARYSTGSTPASNGVAAKQAAAAASVQAKAAPSEKIIVSNLPLDVNEAQVKELFQTTVGPLKEVTLHYDQHGKSKGVAHVQFRNKADATKAYEQYNNRLIDNKRPMKIEIIVDPGKAPKPTLAARVAPNPLAKVADAMEGVESTGTGRGRGRSGRGRGRGRGGRRGGERPQKSAADLDAEMADYNATTAAPEAAAPNPVA